MTGWVSASEAETAGVGRTLAAQLRPGSLVLLEGPLGAGKTALVRGLAEGLGCDPAEVTSPTFTLIQEYRGRFPLQHVDLYRLTPREVDGLALDELLEENIVAIEWPDRWRQAPERAIRVTIEPVDASTRRIAVAGLGSR